LHSVGNIAPRRRCVCVRMWSLSLVFFLCAAEGIRIRRQQLPSAYDAKTTTTTTTTAPTTTITTTTITVTTTTITVTTTTVIF